VQLASVHSSIVKKSSEDSGSSEGDEPTKPVNKPATKVNMLIVG